MKIHSTAYGFYSVPNDGIRIAGFVQANLVPLCELVYPKVQFNFVTYGKSEQIPLCPIGYMDRGTFAKEGSNPERLSNVFLINELLIREDILGHVGDALATLYLLWDYTFQGFRFMHQMRSLKAEDLFGFRPGETVQTLHKGDAQFVSYSALLSFQELVGGKPLDVLQTANTLRVRRTEYTGDLDPPSLIAEFRAAIAARKIDLN